jgi:hypothetical protein
VKAERAHAPPLADPSTVGTVNMTDDALLDQFYAAIKVAGAEALTRCVDAGFELHWQGTSSIPWAGRWRGVDGLLGFFEVLHQHVQLLDVERLHSLSNDEVTVVVLRGRWQIRRSGEEITAMAANVFSLANGRIRSYTVLNNTAAFAGALAAG